MGVEFQVYVHSKKITANASNIIKLQNPTDTKHELIIDTRSDVLPSNDDIAPHGRSTSF
jgi:hypothetical protein